MKMSFFTSNKSNSLQPISVIPRTGCSFGVSHGRNSRQDFCDCLGVKRSDDAAAAGEDAFRSDAGSRPPERTKERLAYVLGRMQEDGVITAEDKDQALATPPKLVAFDRRRRDS